MKRRLVLSRGRSPRSRGRCRRAAASASTSPALGSTHEGAQLFAARCSGCHTSDAGAAGLRDEGLGPRARRRPELQPAQGVRYETCSTRSATAASPGRSCRENIVVGQDAKDVAALHRQVLGQQASKSPRRAPGRGLPAAAGRLTPRRAVLDLRRPARGPRRGARRAGAPRRRRRRRWTRSSRSTSAAARCCPRSRRCAREQNEAGQAIAAAKRARRGRRRGDRADAGGRRAREGARRGAGRGRGRAAAPRWRGSRTCPTRRARRRGHGRCARSASRARPTRAATTSSWPARVIDMERGARLSGSRFAYLRGDLVLLELALVRWALEKLRGHGFEPVIPPVLVREEALYGTGFLPDTEQQIYALPDDDAVPRRHERGRARLAARRRDPRRRRAAAALRRLLPCFRREAGAAGRDTRGIFRVHQFDKVEMFSFVEPEESRGRARAAARDRGGDPAASSGIPYRVVNIAVGDLGTSAAKKYDCEAWLPGQEPLPRADVDARTRPTTRRGASTSASARRRRRPEVPSTRSTGRRSRSAGRSSRCSRTASARTARVELPAVLTAYGAPAVLPASG